MSVTITVNVDVNDIAEKVGGAIDDNTMLEIHNLLAKMCDPYVPMETGTLAQTIEVTPEYVRYISPYAHYQYVGEVYGPNIPIIENGIITGWWSPPNKAKSPTGRAISYSTEVHPLATREWDKAMMRDRGPDFIQGVKDIIIRRI